MGVVFACVHHADVIAHRTGEPYGTLVLTIAVTVIEVALILSIMLAGEGTPTWRARRSSAVIMIVCNGVVGLCLVAGRPALWRAGLPVAGHQRLSGRADAAGDADPDPADLHEQRRRAVLYAERSSASWRWSPSLLYGVFLYVQTVRHRDYFLSDLGGAGDDHAAPAARQVWESVCCCWSALVAVVLLAKSVAGSIETVVTAVGAPTEAVGLLVALAGAAARDRGRARAARRNELQKSLNLALGSSLATIGLTIPAVSMLALMLKVPLELGVDMHDTVLLVLTFAVSLVTFGGGRTNILPGFVHLVLFAIFVFLVFVP